MIYSDSRYSNGKVRKSYDQRTSSFQIGVRRKFPNLNANFYYYVWVEGDRIDNLAYRITANPDNWWKIMDYNPEILDAQNIAPGTTLRIPRV